MMRMYNKLIIIKNFLVTGLAKNISKTYKIITIPI